jgi:MoaA/NifB/PqqE/SkfB family radical SAM enzyme
MEMDDHQNLVVENPGRVFLELTDACNLRCQMCPSGKRGYKSSSLDISMVNDLLDQFSTNLPILHLYEWGEPLLYRNIRAVVEKAVRLGFKTRLSSNFYHVNQDILTFLASSGLHRIRISLDAATPQTYSSCPERK